jgi:hypothetical protein
MTPVVFPEADSFARHLVNGPYALNRWVGSRLAEARAYGKGMAELAGVLTVAVANTAWETIATGSSVTFPAEVATDRPTLEIEQSEIITEW